MKGLVFSIIISVSFVSNLSAQYIVPMKKLGGVYLVPCKLNDLSLDFIFDTGASDVSISLSEAQFMLKNGYLNENDLIGSQAYKMADGSISEGTIVVIRRLEIGGMVLNNIRASIVHSLEAPLLLGQSALEPFGGFYVDYDNSSLVLGKGTASKRNPNSKSARINYSESIVKQYTKWGEYCSACSNWKNSYSVYLKNIGRETLDVMVCVQEINKEWRQFNYYGVKAGETMRAYACETQFGKYLCWAKAAGDQQVVFPTLEQVNQKYP